MRIGLLTLQIHRNYGGTLQNFALQKVLRELGHDPITINRRPPRNEVRYWLSLVKYCIYKIFRRDVSGVFYFMHTKMGQKFYPFVKKYIRLTTPVSNYSNDILKKYNCDIVIVGSDQVWRRGFFPPDFIRNYFGEFLGDNPIPRIAYAASFGVGEWDYEIELTYKCKKLANRFTAISTREDSGVKLCNDYLSYSGAVGVLDPTMLLDLDDYLELCTDVPQKHNNFLFAYILDPNEENIRIINSLSVKLKLTPIIVSAEFQSKYSVEEWISFFRDADFVITDSFHGTVFSIIFNKQFRTISNGQRGNERIFSLFNRFDLYDRIISYDKIDLIKDIEYSKINDKVKQWQVKSFQFLKDACRMAEEIINQSESKVK